MRLRPRRAARGACFRPRLTGRGVCSAPQPAGRRAGRQAGAGVNRTGRKLRGKHGSRIARGICTCSHTFVCNVRVRVTFCLPSAAAFAFTCLRRRITRTARCPARWARAPKPTKSRCSPPAGRGGHRRRRANGPSTPPACFIPGFPGFGDLARHGPRLPKDFADPWVQAHRGCGCAPIAPGRAAGHDGVHELL